MTAPIKALPPLLRACQLPDWICVGCRAFCVRSTAVTAGGRLFQPLLAVSLLSPPRSSTILASSSRLSSSISSCNRGRCSGASLRLVERRWESESGRAGEVAGLREASRARRKTLAETSARRKRVVGKAAIAWVWWAEGRGGEGRGGEGR